jgi:DNA repair protein RecO (recombination protein O)
MGKEEVYFMPPIFKSTEGIVLRVIPFRDYDLILSLFTRDAGLIKVFYKGSRSKRRSAQGMCIPLTKVEVVYREKEGEIFNCHEMTLIEPFTFLRKELLHLEAACDCLNAILASQLVGKAAPQLYALLCFYLQKMPQTTHPWILPTSFRLKLLKHEGLIVFPFRCYECQELLQTQAFTRGSEGWCAIHRPGGCLVWEQEELQMLDLLVSCQNFREIRDQEIALGLQRKIAAFFDACVKR